MDITQAPKRPLLRALSRREKALLDKVKKAKKKVESLEFELGLAARKLELAKEELEFYLNKDTKKRQGTIFNH